MFNLLRKNKTSQIKKYLQEGATLLDVRFASEYNSGHISKSVNIPLQSLDEKMDQLDKDKPIVVYCAMGGRSTIAAAKLKSRGFRVIDGRSIKSIKKLT
ncbi:rhodanese-like domain-containing protein [Nonlabens agnitus]|uniref:Sulfurtransferase n=1 Tax=Nonlabens agnitus TaxID=870484 RepID=A0A2S9WQ96_9FLAO|nr:rhodanese-like domain-containing protein [Nonlabens agnitus]PRP65652.1 sulfurtransferase [Nonlabens agnitus]